MWCGWAVLARGVSAEAMPLVARGDFILGWFPFPGWMVPILVGVCLGVGGLAEKVLGSPARTARKAARLGAAPPGALPPAGPTSEREQDLHEDHS
jgi:hypothetical protein